MKDFIEKLSLGVCEYNNPELCASVSEIEVELNAGTINPFEFNISSGNNVPIKGIVYSTNEKLRIINPTFYGVNIVIKYEINVENVCEGEIIKGNINIISNGGEITIPFTVNVDEKSVETTMGKIKNLYHFTNLVQSSYDEALSIFKSRRFPKIFLHDDFYLESVYEGLIESSDINLAMEEFLIAANKKQRVKISLADTQKQYTNLTENYKDSVTLSKASWGYGKIQVVVDGDFITGYRKSLTTLDFAGNSYEFDYLIDVKKLHQGKNFGSIRFITEDDEYTLYIEVYAKTNYRISNIEYQRYTAKLCRLYIDFRLKKIEHTKWADMSLAILERMRAIKDDSYFYKLFQAQIEISKGHETESAWLLENVAETLIEKRFENMDMYAYYLYVRTLQKRDAAFTSKVIAEVKEYFESGYDSQVLLWILMYLDENYDTNQSIKLARIKEQYKKGSFSPIMYYEAIRVFNEQPEYLRILNDFEIQTLNFGSKEGFVTKKLAEHFADVVMSIKNYNALVLKTLISIYVSDENVKVLTAIVSMLIKGNVTDKEYFFWFEEAVKKELKITGLYEYYMYSLPKDKENDIPNIVLMYFSYNTNLNSDKLPVLFKEVIRHKEDNPSMYEAYSKQMNNYVTEGIINGIANEDIAVVYEDVLKKAMVTPKMAEKLPAIINTYLIECDNKNIRQIIVIHKEIKDVQKVKINNGKAYITVYTDSPAIIFEDIYGNRYCKTINYKMTKLLEMEDYLKMCYEITSEEIGLTLYYADKYIRLKQNPEKSLGILKCIVNDTRIRDSYREYVQNEIIDYYSENYDGEVVDEYLESINDSFIPDKMINRLIDLMMLRGMHIKAWEYINKYGYTFLDTRRLLKCANKLIDELSFEENGKLVAVCEHLFLKGKYNENVLKYLCEYYYGSTKDMYDIWSRCIDYSIVDRGLSEKLLAQMLFTKNYVNKSRKVFMEYARIGATVKMKKAYLFYKAYEYFVKETLIEDEVFEFIYGEIISEKPIPDLCSMALVKHLSEKDSLDDEAVEICRQVIEKLCSKNKMFSFFKKFDKYFKLPSNLLDKTFVEYHTNANAKVYIHYQFQNDYSQNDYIVTEMNSTYSGIFTKEFILFYGEKINYYITEELNGETKVNESKCLTIEEYDMSASTSRYGMLNDIMACQDMKESQTLKDMTLQYVATLELNQSIFSVL